MQRRSMEAQQKKIGPQRVRIDGAGRVVIPVMMRNALGIRAGEELMVSLERDGLRLQTSDRPLARVQAIARRRRRSKGSVVDDFLAERRAEAATD